MNELIQIKTINNQELVPGAELHKFLEVKTHISTWTQRRIKDGGLIEFQDYIFEVDSIGKRNYYFTVDTAKHLSMLERSNKGREARQWFINREKELSSTEAKQIEQKITQPAIAASTPAQLLLQQAQMLVDIESKQIEQDQRLIAIENQIDSSINTGYYKLSIYFNKIRGIAIDKFQAAQLARWAKRYSAEMDRKLGSVEDSAYGTVNTYHKSILDKVADKFINNEIPVIQFPKAMPKFYRQWE